MVFLEAFLRHNNNTQRYKKFKVQDNDENILNFFFSMRNNGVIDKSIDSGKNNSKSKTINMISNEIITISN